MGVDDPDAAFLDCVNASISKLSKMVESNAKNLKARLVDLCQQFSDRVDSVRLRLATAIEEVEVAKAPIQKELNRYAWDWEDCFGLTTEIKKKIEPYNNEIRALTEKKNDNNQLAEIVLDQVTEIFSDAIAFMVEGMPKQEIILTLFDEISTSKGSIDLSQKVDDENSVMAPSVIKKQSMGARVKQKKGLDFKNLRLTPTVMFGHPDTTRFDFLESYDKVEGSNNLQIQGVSYTPGQWDFNFILSNGWKQYFAPKEGISEETMINPPTAIIRIIEICVNNSSFGQCLAGLRFFDCNKKKILQAGKFYESSEHFQTKSFALEENERVVGVRSSVGKLITLHYDVQFKIAKIV